MTYEFLCLHCGEEFEAELPISADPVATCPKCKKTTVLGPDGRATAGPQRLVSGGTGFSLKGPRWSPTGYHG